MALQGFVIYLKCIVVCTVLSLVSSLTLPYMVTTKPRHTKFIPSPAPPGKTAVETPTSAPTLKSGVAEYRFRNNKGETCILMRTDALVEVNFKSNIGDEKGDSYIPRTPMIEGNCGAEDEAMLRLNWEGYSLVLNFDKTPGGERWYIASIQLTVSIDLPQYHNIKIRGNNLKLAHKQMVLATPVGMSYTCADEQIFDLVPEDEDDAPPGLSGKLFLRELQIQAFIYKGSTFGPPFKCNVLKGFRDETAPIAVGSTLAIAVLATVTGYGVFRYFKVKKVQYNTME